jgi:hypothetical protein
MGLTVESTLHGLSDHEQRLRKRLLKCCLTFDQAWSLYAGHPAVLRRKDLPLLRSTTPSGPLPLDAEHAFTPDCTPPGMQELYHAMSDLMDLGSKMVHLVANSDSAQGHGGNSDKLLALATLNNELNAWSQGLPPSFRWSNENANNAPVLFFMMQ